MLLRPVETPETLPGGKVVLTETTREALTTHQMEVVSVGKYPLCDDTDCERTHYWSFTGEGGRKERQHVVDIEAGQWVLVRHRSLTETHEDGLFACHQDDVLAILEAEAPV